MTNTAAIAIQGLTKSFKDHAVLKGVDLSVPKGSIFALLGENGAGKTTLIRIIATLLKADGGTVSVNGFDTLREPDKVRQSISLTGQFTAVDDILTGRENLVLIATLRHLPNAADVAKGLLERFGLTDAADRRAGTYSGGMKRRLDLAMSFVGQPPIIFLDEPTTGLDPIGRKEVWDMIRELGEHGTSIFLTTQYLDEAEELADRIAILAQGRIIADAPLTELQKLLPETEEVYVKKEPSLEEIFIHITNEQKNSAQASEAEK